MLLSPPEAPWFVGRTRKSRVPGAEETSPVPVAHQKQQGCAAISSIPARIQHMRGDLWAQREVWQRGGHRHRAVVLSYPGERTRLGESQHKCCSTGDVTWGRMQVGTALEGVPRPVSIRATSPAPIRVGVLLWHPAQPALGLGGCWMGEMSPVMHEDEPLRVPC